MRLRASGSDFAKERHPLDFDVLPFRRLLFGAREKEVQPSIT